MNALAVLLLASAVCAQVARGPHGSAELVVEDDAFVPGRPLSAGILFKLEPGWHVYWRNPGDSGEPPRARWTLPPGFSASPLSWPHPELITVGPLANFGYEREVLFPASIATPASFPKGRKARLSAELDWLVCKEECLPASGTASLELPAKGRKALFERTRLKLPASFPAWKVSAGLAGDGIQLSIAPPGPKAGEYRFFPSEPGVLENAAPQLSERAEDGSTRLLLVRSEQVARAPERLKGVLVFPGGFDAAGRDAMDVDLPLASAPPGSLSLWTLAAAFLGGLLLNLMPCVFPVLAVKATGFLKASTDGRSLARHGAAYSAGVLACFLSLGGLLLALRAGGTAAGWGFQLQSPAFAAGMALLFLLIGLNMLGVFEAGVALTRLGAGSGGAFLSGAFAVLVATPCTAPFMGAALGAALTLPAAAALAVFAAMGAGMAVPYLLLCLRPGVLRLLPRPGAWMEALKQALAFPMLAAAVWLFWVFARQAGADAAARLLWAAWCAGLAAWLWGRWGQSPSPTTARGAARVLCALAAAGALALLRSAPEKDSLWREWSPELEASLRAEGRPVLVDFTAAWCVTCQVNERAALSSPSVRARLSSGGIAALKADWTSRDPRITAALGALGRSGVPVYALYAPGAREAVLLPSVLTPGIVLDALEKLH